jgi:hypothetical protein
MPVQLSGSVRSARAAAIESGIGASAKLKIFSGAQPANCAAADPSGLLCTIDLPSDYLAAGAAGVVSKNGTWSGTGSGAGNAASWRIYATDGTTCHMQGSAGAPASGADMILDNVNIASGQTVTVNSFAWTDGNA